MSLYVFVRVWPIILFSLSPKDDQSILINVLSCNQLVIFRTAYYLTEDIFYLILLQATLFVC